MAEWHATTDGKRRALSGVSPAAAGYVLGPITIVVSVFAWLVRSSLFSDRLDPKLTDLTRSFGQDYGGRNHEEPVQGCQLVPPHDGPGVVWSRDSSTGGARGWLQHP